MIVYPVFRQLINTGYTAHIIFIQSLEHRVTPIVSDFNRQTIFSATSTHIDALFDQRIIPAVMRAYSDAITTALYAPVTTACLALLAGCVVP